MRVSLTLLASASVVSAWTELLHKTIMHKNIDAIVSPGAYTSHMHTFFGSDAITNVMPTTEDLQQGCYSGSNPNDFSAYWIPTLYHVDGDKFTEVTLFTFGTYYTTAYAEIPIPKNFSMISGKASAKTQAEADHPENGLQWYCEESPGVLEPDAAKMPTKACQQHLRFSLLFPNCVDPNNISIYGFSDSSTNKCPEGMKRMPQLRYSARYDTKKAAPNGWNGPAPFQLSCSDTPGDGYCFHGDFINGWYEDAALDMLISDGNGRDNGRFISGSHGTSTIADNCNPTDRDPENGTSDYWTSLEMKANGGIAAPGPVASTPSITSSTMATSVTAPSANETGQKRGIGQKSKNFARLRQRLSADSL
ncbi:hypothetical protein TWF569_000368 [Orbilia oligospora]|nr:hypothetical protein TWF569_000368 [Orbilia oligospora]